VDAFSAVLQAEPRLDASLPLSPRMSFAQNRFTVLPDML
jgi:hypothetical protein